MTKRDCPICQKETSYEGNDYRPFCSERCQKIDLGHWLTEEYSTPATDLNDKDIEELESALENKSPFH